MITFSKLTKQLSLILKPKYIIFIFSILLFTTCCSVTTSSTDFPYNSYDYSTSQITLGISFPPVNGAEQYQLTFDSMSELSMDRMRMDVHWSYIEPTQGNRDWLSLANRLNILTTQGHKVFLTIDLKSFPTWFGSLDATAQQNSLRTFVQEMLNNYKHQISYLQFGNEWNWEVKDHFNGNLTQFIALGDIVYHETVSYDAPRPEVVLASLSTAGLSALAISQDRITNVYFNEVPLYTQAEIDGLDKPGYLLQVNEVFGGIRFESIDLHLYADYWNWGIYLDALGQALTAAGKSNIYPIIASEFGGVHPVMESLDQITQADRIVSYIHTLDNLNIRDAYFFKLVENPVHDTEFWNSYLIEYNGLKKTIGYEVLRRFGLAAKAR
jgi:hypothetical protein